MGYSNETKLKEKIKKLEERIDELSYILELSYDGIVVVDNNAVIEYANEGYESITGIRRSRVVGRGMRDLFDEGFNCNPNIIFTILETKKTYSTKMINRKKGTEILLTGKPILDNEGNIKKIVINVRDISQLNSLKADLDKAQKLNELYEDELKTIRIKEKQIIARSESMKKIVALATKLAKVNSSILITGESGTGKDVIARLVHELSDYSDKPFVRVNCSAIPDNLLESEMFGYEKGAFSGANAAGKPGLFEVADGGTIFLDEIGEMPLILQPKVLMAIQEQEITRLGSVRSLKINARIIAATNRNLNEMIQENLFREDLFYRLNVVPINVPPLRERKEDIIPLVKYFHEKLNEKYNDTKTIHSSVMEILEGYEWPGNVRELKNIVERLYVLSDANEISIEALPDHLKKSNINDQVAKDIDSDGDLDLNKAVQSFERKIILNAISKHKSIRKASSMLGVSHPTIIRKMKKYKINLD